MGKYEIKIIKVNTKNLKKTSLEQINYLGTRAEAIEHFESVKRGEVLYEEDKTWEDRLFPDFRQYKPFETRQSAKRMGDIILIVHLFYDE